MSHRANRIVNACLISPTEGVVELDHDWRARYTPPIKFSGGLRVDRLSRASVWDYGKESGYFVDNAGRIHFILSKGAHPRPFARRGEVFLAGDFNGWGDAIGQPRWKLNPVMIGDLEMLGWEGNATDFKGHPSMRFKFVTSEGQWYPVAGDAPNVVADGGGNRNRIVNLDRTGRHVFRFRLRRPLDLTRSRQVVWTGGEEPQSVELRPGPFFYDLQSDLAMGTEVGHARTRFRLFAPRAKTVTVGLSPTFPATESTEILVALERRQDDHGRAGVWEATFPRDLHGWFYWYHIDGPNDPWGLFEPERRVLDPYAIASVSREGPGVLLNQSKIAIESDGFVTPAWQDLVICEAHVRDLVAHAPIKLSPEERRGFSGLAKWVRSPEFYLKRLGVNCVELQPVQEFDNQSVEEYHWGYMTNNYFAPESTYALEPAKASGVAEFQDVVRAFHEQGIAVVLDVVYNHVGVPGHLMFIDKLYYFEVEAEGELSNWSGCGNDLRARSAMAQRLIIDSCTHLIKTYGVDGFRFDLAELLTFEVLVEIERALKTVKPDVVLIAEPWSFRGHLAGELSATGWASWNDGYRRFAREFLRGGSTREAFEYFLKGSPWYFAKWPAQTVNYVESHDDRTWIDEITERPDGNGHSPTPNDRRRTHLMAALLFSSVGIPMISAGQDFLRSKHGVNNTYQRGDLNALNYLRQARYPGSHSYFADWIAFRLSAAGRLMRHYTRATEGFFAFWFAENSTAAAVLYNADLSQGTDQLLLAINPTAHDADVSIDPATAERSWVRVADHEHFPRSERLLPPAPLPEAIWVPALGCGLWRSDSEGL